MKEPVAITWVRHGESEGALNGCFQLPEYELTEKGKAEISALAVHLKESGCDAFRIVTSPYTRTRQSAEILGQVLGLPVVEDPLWCEIDFGTLHGKTLAEVGEEANHGGFFEPTGKTGESLNQLVQRCGRGIQRLLLESQGHTLVVSHGHILNTCLQLIHRRPPSHHHRGTHFQFSNAGYSSTEYDFNNDRWLLETHNMTCPVQNTRSKGMPYEFTFVRHGESQGNVDGLFQGQAEYPLTDNGFKQARLLGERWEKERVTFDRVFASPLFRAMDTALTATRKMSIEVEPVALLKEVDNGRLAGLSGRDEEAAGIDRHDHRSIFAPIGDTGESWWELYLRANQVMDWMIQQGPGNYLVVAHGAILRAILRVVTGNLPYSSIPVGLWLGNTAIHQAGYDPGKDLWVLRKFNDDLHLQGKCIPY